MSGGNYKDSGPPARRRVQSDSSEWLPSWRSEMERHERSLFDAHLSNNRAANDRLQPNSLDEKRAPLWPQHASHKRSATWAASGSASMFDSLRVAASANASDALRVAASANASDDNSSLPTHAPALPFVASHPAAASLKSSISSTAPSSAASSDGVVTASTAAGCTASERTFSSSLESPLDAPVGAHFAAASSAPADAPADSSRKSDAYMWTVEEDLFILTQVTQHGRRWSKIAASLPGRTDNGVRNRWNRMEKARSIRLQRGSNPGYRCRRCGQYKRGHICAALTQGEMPQGEELAQKAEQLTVLSATSLEYIASTDSMLASVSSATAPPFSGELVNPLGEAGSDLSGPILSGQLSGQLSSERLLAGEFRSNSAPYEPTAAPRLRQPAGDVSLDKNEYHLLPPAARRSATAPASVFMREPPVQDVVAEVTREMGQTSCDHAGAGGAPGKEVRSNGSAVENDDNDDGSATPRRYINSSDDNNFDDFLKLLLRHSPRDSRQGSPERSRVASLRASLAGSPRDSRPCSPRDASEASSGDGTSSSVGPVTFPWLPPTNPPFYDAFQVRLPSDAND